jgi:hypothetical protein
VTYFEPMAVDDRLWPIARATVATRHGNYRSKHPKIQSHFNEIRCWHE